MMTLLRTIGAVSILLVSVHPAASQESTRPFVPIGLFIGKIEEGARIFTPVRLLPFDHPESGGHQFTNALQLYGTELGVLLWLGHQAGYELWATLTRYPKEPSPAWPYPMFSQPDTSGLRGLHCIRRPASDVPLKGLRAALFERGELVCYIVGTRDLTMKEHGMQKATSVGLDMTRAEFLAALSNVRSINVEKGPAAVIFAR